MDVARWQGVGRAVLADALPAVAAGAVMALGSGPAAMDEVPPRRPLDALAYVLMGVAAVVLVGRRRWPLVALATTAGASIAFLALQYPHGPILLAMSVAMYAVAVRLPVGPSLAACGVTMVAVVIPDLVVTDPERLPVEAPVLLAVLSGCCCRRGRSARWCGLVERPPGVPARTRRGNAATRSGCGLPGRSTTWSGTAWP